jgi:secreted trypsin-like serine protease
VRFRLRGLHLVGHRPTGKLVWHVAGIVAVVAALVAVGPAGAITFGSVDTEHTNVGAILVFSLRSQRWFEFCSGTLVSERIFLTAGHCTDALLDAGVGMGRIRVSFALDLFARGARWLEVEAVMNHPDYNWGPTSDPHDVGVIVLKHAVRNLAPATLAPVGTLDALEAAGALDGASFTVVGYGADETGSPTGVRMVAFSEFLSLHDAWLYMSQNPNTGDSGTCGGDSGGPTFFEVGGAEVLVAITSWGDAVCLATGINYRMDLASSQAFVADAIAATS